MQQEQNRYVLFIENCRKDNIVVVNYLQYNGNEHELAKLYKLICQTEEEGYRLNGDLSSFSMDIKTLISEEAVESHINAEFNYYIQFRKLNGKFTCPFNLEKIGYKLYAIDMDEYFYRGEICYCFKL